MGEGDSGEPTPNPKLQVAIATCESNLAGLTRLLREAEKNFGQGHAISESLRQEWQVHQDKLEALRRDKLDSLPKHVLLKRKEQARDQTKAKLGKTERAIQETKAQLEAAQKRLEELAVQQSEQQAKLDNLQKEVAALAVEVVQDDPKGASDDDDLQRAVEEAKAAAARAEAASARALAARRDDRSEDIDSAAEDAKQAAATAAAALKRAQEAQTLAATAKRQHKA
jgi:chromosome segregation ATPase